MRDQPAGTEGHRGSLRLYYTFRLGMVVFGFAFVCPPVYPNAVRRPSSADGAQISSQKKGRNLRRSRVRTARGHSKFRDLRVVWVRFPPPAPTLTDISRGQRPGRRFVASRGIDRRSAGWAPEVRLIRLHRSAAAFSVSRQATGGRLTCPPGRASRYCLWYPSSAGGASCETRTARSLHGP
jgi:hypothetical protein